MTQQLVGTELVFTQHFNAAERQVLPVRSDRILDRIGGEIRTVTS